MASRSDVPQTFTLDKVLAEKLFNYALERGLEPEIVMHQALFNFLEDAHYDVVGAYEEANALEHLARYAELEY